MNNLDNLTKSQIVLLVLLVSFVTSLATGIVTVTLMNQSPPAVTHTISKIVEKTATKEAPAQKLFEQAEDKIIRIIKTASPAVVSVIASKDVPMIEEYGFNPFGDDFFKNFPGFLPGAETPQPKEKSKEKKQISSGSGFFISKEGVVLTNKHVVEDPEAEYSVIMNDGRKLEAKVLARNPFQDIAILKVEGKDFDFISLGDSDKLSIGQTAIAIGNALGEFQNTVSVGVVSGLNRKITAFGAGSGPETLSGLIQTDAAINPGNSGGPLFNLDGKAVGINTARAQAENVGFALPINVAKRDAADVTQFGKISYPYIGIRYKITDKGLVVSKGEKEEFAVDPNGPAAKAGVKEGDIIAEVSGVKLDQKNTLTSVLSNYRVGDSVKLKILRDSKELTVSVVLGARPENS